MAEAQAQLRRPAAQRWQAGGGPDRHWREDGEFRAHCSTKWASFLLSLRDLVETGRGRRRTT